MLQSIINGLISGSSIALVALSFSIIYSTVRFFHFAHAGIFLIAAYTYYLFIVVLKWPFFLAVIMGLIISCGVVVLIEKAIYNPLIKKGASPLILFLASLGVYIVIQNLIALFFGGGTLSIRSGIIKEGIIFFGARITPIQICILIANIILFFGISLLITKSLFGKKIIALASDADLAFCWGLNITKLRLSSFIIGSALAAIAALLIVLDVDMNLSIGMNYFLLAVVATIIGGIGSISGAAIGGILLGLILQFATYPLSSRWQTGIAFLIMFIFLIFRPYGIRGTGPSRV